MHMTRCLAFTADLADQAAMLRLLSLLMLLASLAVHTVARADPADIAAAERGVVRVVIIGTDGQEIYPVSHGSGFAVSPTMIVTNAHVVREAMQDDTLRVGIVTSQGDDAVYAKVLSVSPRNDLALVETTGKIRLPPLTIAGGTPQDNGEVTAVGYPMNVDRAQGLEIGDIFRSQPAVKAKGFLSGARPSRQFDTILHTAPIARGNSGGPLLDACGRVLGVNSFGADSGGSDAEFFFAVSNRELLPFLRENKVDLRLNALPCRSFAEIDADERTRLEREQAAAQASLNAETQGLRDRRERVRLEAVQSVQESRENAMALAFLLALIGWSAASYALYIKRRDRDEDEPNNKAVMIAGAIAAAAFVAALAVWFSRPGIDEIDRRIADGMQDGDTSPPMAGSDTGQSAALLCTVDEDRSRIVGASADDIALDWRADGCVNGRTQYGLTSGTWTRIFVPQSEDAVSVNTYDPKTRTFRSDRYLLSRNAIEEARIARRAYTPPQCETENAAQDLGVMQSGVITQLPDRPNERVVYRCAPKQVP